MPAPAKPQGGAKEGGAEMAGGSQVVGPGQNTAIQAPALPATLQQSVPCPSSAGPAYWPAAAVPTRGLVAQAAGDVATQKAAPQLVAPARRHASVTLRAGSPTAGQGSPPPPPLGSASPQPAATARALLSGSVSLKQQAPAAVRLQASASHHTLPARISSPLPTGPRCASAAASEVPFRSQVVRRASSPPPTTVAAVPPFVVVAPQQTVPPVTPQATPQVAHQARALPQSPQPALHTPHNHPGPSPGQRKRREGSPVILPERAQYFGGRQGRGTSLGESPLLSNLKDSGDSEAELDASISPSTQHFDISSAQVPPPPHSQGSTSATAEECLSTTRGSADLGLRMRVSADLGRVRRKIEAVAAECTLELMRAQEALAAGEEQLEGLDTRSSTTLPGISCVALAACAEEAGEEPRKAPVARVSSFSSGLLSPPGSCVVRPGCREPRTAGAPSPVSPEEPLALGAAFRQVQAEIERQSPEADAAGGRR